jgi:hypothetical protein
MLSGHDIYRHMELFIQQAHGYTQQPVFMFKGRTEQYGTDDLPGSSTPPAPALSPNKSEVRYDGRKWLVAAQRPYPPDWIYVLAPATATATVGATGPSGPSGATGTS